MNIKKLAEINKKHGGGSVKNYSGTNLTPEAKKAAEEFHPLFISSLKEIKERYEQKHGKTDINWLSKFRDWLNSFIDKSSI